jgi:hypothetical protein
MGAWMLLLHQDEKHHLRITPCLPRPF